VSYVVFAQASEPKLPLVRLLENARRFFELELNVLEELELGVRLDVELAKSAHKARFLIAIEPTSAALLERARRAEIAGRAAGMATLAERCAFVWRIEPENEAPPALLLTLSGLLASVALGPVLPADDSTLFGVRGAIERAQKA
jgi:hypothetical protein